MQFFGYLMFFIYRIYRLGFFNGNSNVTPMWNMGSPCMLLEINWVASIYLESHWGTHLLYFFRQVWDYSQTKCVDDHYSVIRKVNFPEQLKITIYYRLKTVSTFCLSLPLYFINGFVYMSFDVNSKTNMDRLSAKKLYLISIKYTNSLLEW